MRGSRPRWPRATRPSRCSSSARAGRPSCRLEAPPRYYAPLLGPAGAAADVDLELVRYDVDRGVLPDRVDECDGWLCSPSRSSVYDADPWIADAEEIVREVVQREIPYVGICFGHQLLGRALGVPVTRADCGWNVGVHDYDICAPQPWMAPHDRRISLLASHQDQVDAVPADATLLLEESDGQCPIAGMAVGTRAWSLQAHPEFVAPLAEHLLSLRVELIGAERVAEARASLDRALDGSTVARWITRFFAET